MNRVVAPLLLFGVAAIACAAPTPSDVQLAQKYSAAIFSTGSRAADHDYGNCKLYTLADRTRLWVFDEGYTVAEIPDGAIVRYFLKDGRTTQRSIQLPSGRACMVDDDGALVWQLVKEPAPDFRLGTLGNAGSRVRLSDLRGKVVLLDSWASWCGPCMQALPKTEALYQKYKDRGLLVFGINIEGDERRAAVAVKTTGITFPVLMGEPGASGDCNWDCRQITDYRIYGIPALFLIDKDGIIQRMDDVDDEVPEEML